jgi:hypothetical protein
LTEIEERTDIPLRRSKGGQWLDESQRLYEADQRGGAGEEAYDLGDDEVRYGDAHLAITNSQNLSNVFTTYGEGSVWKSLIIMNKKSKRCAGFVTFAQEDQIGGRRT